MGRNDPDGHRFLRRGVQRHDADALALSLTDDTVFEDTSSPPDGRRSRQGRARGLVAAVGFRHHRGRVDAEEVIVSGDRRSAMGLLQAAQRPAVAPPRRSRLHLRGEQAAAKLADVKG